MDSSPGPNFVDHCLYSAVAIGLCDGGTALNKFPGWTASAWAYHSDDEKKYHNENYGFEYSEKCSVGDKIGCFLDIRAGKLISYKTVRLVVRNI